MPSQVTLGFSHSGRHEHGSKIRIAYSLGHQQGGSIAAWCSQQPYLPPSNDQYLAGSDPHI